MEKQKIGFIGGGNMAASLIGGLLAGDVPAANIIVGEASADRRQWLEQNFNIATTDNNADVIGQSDTVLLAVKPQQMKELLLSLRESLQSSQPLLISIAAGVRESNIQEWSGGALSVVRVMPNTPALVGAGAAGLYANELTTPEQKSLAESIMQAVGVAIWVDDESEIDLVTAISGSGPAYFFLLMEAMEATAIELGLDNKQARLLTLETALGAAKLALLSEDGPADLRKKVTSPGGTTEAAINTMQQQHVPEAIRQAIKAAAERSRQLAEQSGS